MIIMMEFTMIAENAPNAIQRLNRYNNIKAIMFARRGIKDTKISVSTIAAPDPIPDPIIFIAFHKRAETTNQPIKAIQKSRMFPALKARGLVKATTRPVIKVTNSAIGRRLVVSVLINGDFFFAERSNTLK